MSARFNYVKYDEGAVQDQESAKTLVQEVEVLIESIGYSQPIPSAECTRAKALALTKLEECYMWIGKAIRDDQIARGAFAEHQPDRSNN